MERTKLIINSITGKIQTLISKAAVMVYTCLQLLDKYLKCGKINLLKIPGFMHRNISLSQCHESEENHTEFVFTMPHSGTDILLHPLT
jgi:hypothetical protein